jgi:hypothetical protein
VFHPAGTAQAIGLTSGGSIVLGGVHVQAGQRAQDLGYLVRLNEAGDLDSGFGSNGLVMAEVPPNGWIAVPRGAAVPAEFGRLSRVFDLSVDYSDRIVVVGSAAATSNLGRAAAARVLPDGEADTSFAGTGLVLLATDDQVDESPFATAMAVDPTGGYWVTAAFVG